MVQNADYRKQVIHEYAGNPLIEALPDIWSGEEVVEKLTEEAGHNEGERMLDARYRMHCIQRLFRYFQPLEQHVDIEQRISRCIRQGYLCRNPLFKEYAQGLNSSYHELTAHGDSHNIRGFRPTAAGFTIIGMSGVGKSSAVERILALYPQIVRHGEYQGQAMIMTQLVWLKLDCPHDGSIKGLCFEFFAAVDAALGTDYFAKYTKARYTVDVLMIHMTQLAHLYCIGVIIIDEIQHLSLAKGGGSDKMLNFFVTLVNTIGVPIVLIGTTKAMSILQSEFRQARRGSGQGDLLWDRMGNDISWEIMVSSMWENQWTKEAVPQSGEMQDTLYDESQGIIDIAVKLYAMVQIKAISTGRETFRPEDIRRAAREKLGLVSPMLEALRKGDKRKIEQYGDISPISIEDYLSAYTVVVEKTVPIKEKKSPISIMEQAVLKLLELGVEPQEAKRLAGKALASASGVSDVGTIVRKAYREFILLEEKKEAPQNDVNDLRESRGYGELKAKGLIEEDEAW